MKKPVTIGYKLKNGYKKVSNFTSPMNDNNKYLVSSILPDDNGDFTPCPELLTEDELIKFLRISQISNSKDHHNVIEHLKRYRDLPRIHICNKVLYPTQAIREWIEKETTNGN